MLGSFFFFENQRLIFYSLVYRRASKKKKKKQKIEVQKKNVFISFAITPILCFHLYGLNLMTRRFHKKHFRILSSYFKVPSILLSDKIAYNAR